MKFAELQARLLARIRHLIHNGELTERGFARISGISQPHIHKVLKGTRTLSTTRFDFLLRSLNYSLLDLFQEVELRNYLGWASRSRPAHTELPIHQCPLGPGVQWSPERFTQDHHLVPCTLFAGEGRPALVRLMPDPSMADTLAHVGIAVVKLNARVLIQPGCLYAIDRGRDTVVRRIRRGASCLYLISDENQNNPANWETVPLFGATGRSVILGRVVWLGEQSSRSTVRRAWSRQVFEATSSYVSRT